jgi:hypothetical protein
MNEWIPRRNRLPGHIFPWIGALLLLILSAGCEMPNTDSSPPSAAGDTLQNNAELAAMYAADQKARENLHTILGDPEALRALVVDDSLRRVRVQEIMDRGKVRTADDYYHAAMILQHGGDTTAYRTAHELAKQAVALDSTHRNAKWMTAASWDRYLVGKGEPQWYGTQYFKNRYGDWEIRPIDTTRVTDSERLRHGVPTLADARARIDSMNAAN